MLNVCATPQPTKLLMGNLVHANVPFCIIFEKKIALFKLGQIYPPF